MTTTTAPAPSAPDQSRAATRAIEAALASPVRPISHYTARLIAAAINEGDDSPLEHFAATGQFDIELCGHEAQRVALPTRQEPWRRALLEFLLSMRRAHPWNRGLKSRRTPRAGASEPFADGERDPSREPEK